MTIKQKASQVKRWICKRPRCKWAWRGMGQSKPKVCPRCKSYIWDRDESIIGGITK